MSKQAIPENAKKVFSGIIFDVYQWEQKMYDGSVRTFEKLKRPDTVLLVPITAAGEIIFIEEEQPGKELTLQLPGGRAESGESPEVSAARELLEETGYQSTELSLVDSVQPIGKIEQTLYVFAARNCRKVAKQNLDGGEKITLKMRSFEEAVEIMASDAFPDRLGELARMAIRATYDPLKKEELKRLLYTD